jgi:hypothetical protein
VGKCPHPFGHPDSAKRMSEGAMLAWEADEWASVGKFMAFKLEDGSTDHVLYPRKRDAVTHVSNEFHYCFIQLHPGGMGLCEAHIMLEFHRKAYKAGFRLADPEAAHGGRSPIPRIGEREVLSQISALNRKGR